MQFGLFEAISVKVTKACIGPDRTVLYSICTTNKESHAEFTTTKCDADFEYLLSKICSILEHGHSCQALCPWFYVDIQHKIPKKPWFRSATHVRVVEGNLHAYQGILDMLLIFINSPHNRACHRATEKVPNALFQFLFPNGSKINPEMYAAASPPKHRLSSHNGVRQSESDTFFCTICQGGANFSSSRTTLPCLHSFHDDCIVNALNVSPICPVCSESITTRASM